MKVLKGKTVLEHIIFRVSQSKYLSKIVVATTTNPMDDIVEEKFRYNTKVAVFRGDEDDVLSRFYYAVKRYPMDIIVRITADDLLKEPTVIDQLIEIIMKNPNLDYCSNTIEPTFPEGIDAEVFKFTTLEKAFREAKLKSEREHVTPYIYKHPEKFSLYNLKYSRNLSSWRWTLDNEDDWKFFELVYDHFYRENQFFGMEEVISWLEKHPEIVTINQSMKRNEGYLKSIEKEHQGKK